MSPPTFASLEHQITAEDMQSMYAPVGTMRRSIYVITICALFNTKIGGWAPAASTFFRTRLTGWPENGRPKRLHKKVRNSYAAHLTTGRSGDTRTFEMRPDTAKPLYELANMLLHSPNTLAEQN